MEEQIEYIEDLEEYRKKNIIITPNTLFNQYLNILYPNLILREDTLSETIDLSINSHLSSYKSIYNKTLMDKTISLNTFTQYMDIQNLIAERIFKYIDKSKKGRLTKTDFCNGMYQIFYGNVSELSKLTFFICDFNEDGKIFKSDMKLILAYIPNTSNSNSNQQEYIKTINKKIDEFFKEIKKELTKSNEFNEEEIDYNLYLTKITESINDKKINGAFFLFINLLKYIFINKPFNKETINAVTYAKNKHLLKLTLPKGIVLKPTNFLDKKSLAKSQVFEPNKNDNITNIKMNAIKESIKINNLRKNVKKSTDFKNYENNGQIGKIPKANIFSMKKSSSTSIMNRKMNKKNENKNNDFILSKDKENDINSNEDFNMIIKDMDFKTNLNKRIRLNSGKVTLSSQKYDNKNLRSDNKFNTIFLRNIKKIEFENKESKNIILPSIYNYSPVKKKKKINVNPINIHNNKKFKLSPNTPIIKLNNKDSSPSNFLLNDDKIIKKEENDDSSSNSIDENEFYLYKYSEEEHISQLKKYYAVINKKEILFYSSNLKKELLSIWNYSNTIISIKGKVSLKENIFYPIKILYKNSLMSIIFLEDKESQIKFGNKLKININNNNFEDKYETKEKLGEGHFAIVKKCIEKQSGKEYAVKIISKQKLGKIDMDLIIQEKNYMRLINHPNIVCLVEDFEDEKYIYLVMEYYKGGDLYSYIKEYRNNDKILNEKAIAKIIKIIAQSIQYLNNFGIVHRDLKPENIVFGTQKDISSLTIIDLGVAITLSYGQMNSDPIGTLEFIPPEIFTRKPYSHKVDVWAIGIILYILVTCGKVYPFDCDSKDKKEKDKIIGKKIVFLHQEYPEEFFGNKSKYLISLLDKTLEKSSEKRISINEFLDNYWLTNNSK